MFNGQQASVNDNSQRPFVTSVTPVVGDFAAAQAPVIVVLSEGTSLNVQAVVSNDRRFVRLTLVPFFSKIGDVEEFTFEGRRSSRTGTAVTDPTDETETVRNDEEEIIEGTTVQLPQFAFTSVSTTVSVPGRRYDPVGWYQAVERRTQRTRRPDAQQAALRQSPVQERRHRPHDSKPDDDGDASHHHSGGRRR